MEFYAVHDLMGSDHNSYRLILIRFAEHYLTTFYLDIPDQFYLYDEPTSTLPCKDGRELVHVFVVLH